MPSPLETLVAKRTFYFDAPLRDAVKKFDDVDCFQGESVDLVFTVKDANGNPVDLTGATVTFKAAVNYNGTIHTIMSKSDTDGIDVDGAEATVSFNGDDLGSIYTKFMGQLVITDSGSTVVASVGTINLCGVAQ